MTLKGDVEWQYQKLEAERAVRGLWGVKGVTNLIIVKPAASPSDLKKKIEDALIRTAQIDASNITVEVQGNKAILKGQRALLGRKTGGGKASVAGSGNHLCR